MRHFLFEDKTYRINPYFKRQKAEPDSAQALARLLRRGSGGNRGKTDGGRSHQVDVRQKCVVKMQYSNSMESHRVQLEKYLGREGTDIDGGRAKLYGTDTDEYRNHMVKKNFRIFLSPQSNRVDLTDMAERFVQKLEFQTGYKLYWQAANHYNTAHPHTHLLINGKDRSGKEVTFPRDMVKTFMREYAKNICTAQIGNRTREEITLEKEKALTAPRYTRLDETIKGLCGGTFRVNLPEQHTEQERILTRLEHLRKMNLCVYKDGGYKLSPRWEENLRANGRYNAFLKARSVLQYTNPSQLRVYSGEQGDITGKVTKVYRTDGDASDNHAVILESINGRAYFVPLMNKPGVWHRYHKTALKEGELVTIKTHKNQQGRLTPVIFKQEAAQVRKEIRGNGYSGSLADTVMNEVKQRERVRDTNTRGRVYEK